MGIHYPRVRLSITLSAIFFPTFIFTYSFFRTTNWRKIRVAKEYGSYARGPKIIWNHDDLIISTKFLNLIYFFSRTTKRKIIVGKNYGIRARVRVSSSKYSWLPMSTKFLGFILSLSRPISPRRNIRLRKEYRTLAGHDAKLGKNWFLVYQ